MCDPSKYNTFANAKIVGNIGLMLNGVPIPEEMLILILSFIEPGRLLTISMVCKNWCIIVRSYTFWNKKYWTKCNHQAQKVPWFVFYCLFTRKCFTNILNNCNGENGFEKWRFDRNNWNGFDVENPPIGVCPLPSNVPEFQGFTSCFSTFRKHCMKSQSISLERDVLLSKVIHMVRPRILLSEWIGAKLGTNVTYSSTLNFFDKSGRFIFQTKGIEKTNNFYKNAWIKVQRVIMDYPFKVQTITFRHSVFSHGINSCPSIKMAGAVVRFEFECINLSLNK